jgi:5S rRNA maturation endonuclease (ribonuclease M5)
MNLIQAAVQAVLPPKRKQTPSGWISFNAPCCIHKGEKQDTRLRGGILMSGEGFQYHCFNCNFKAGWTPGKLFSNNTKSLFRWFGMPETDIQKLGLHALKEKEDQPKPSKELSFVLEDRPLPEDCLPVAEWLNAGLEDQEFVAVIDYIINKRKLTLEDYNWHWSSANGYKDRVIIPFYQDGRIVGWTGRKIVDGKPKYLTHTQPGYVFNIDKQTSDKQYVIVVEGQFDAIAIDGVAVMHNEPNETQCARINALGKEVIVVPDRDKPGAKMIAVALEHGWTVSLPDWNEDIKDVADAVKKYGKFYTLFSILHYREKSEIKQQLLKKKLENVQL